MPVPIAVEFPIEIHTGISPTPRKLCLHPDAAHKAYPPVDRPQHARGTTINNVPNHFEMVITQTTTI